MIWNKSDLDYVCYNIQQCVGISD